MVCPVCAEMLTPIRIELDRLQLSVLPETLSTSHGRAGIGRAVAHYATRVLAMRPGPPPDAVRLRASDAHVLAAQLGTTRTDLAGHLESLGVLAGLDIADSPVPSGFPSA
jgi:hypothetical protein